MSKKNLLNEATVRKFMKLANINPLAEQFVSTHLQEEDEEVELEEGDYMGKDDMEDEPMGAEDPMGDMGDEDEMIDMDDEEMDMEDDMGGDAEVTLDETDVEALRDALAAAQAVMDKLAGGLGGGEEMDDMEDEPMDMEDDEEMVDPGEPEMEEEPAMRDMMEEEGVDIDLVDEDALVAEVLKKVVNKLSKKG